MIGNIMCNLRRAGFLKLDELRGSSIKRSYERLKRFEGIGCRSSEIESYHMETLRELINHAKESTSFYSEVEGERLEDFPVINKDVIRKQQEKFLSKNYNKSELIIMSTSGSTGTPFKCYQDRDKKKSVSAELIYYSEKAGYKVGGNLIFLRGLSKSVKKSRIKQWIQNETLIYISKLGDREVEEILRRVRVNSGNGSMMLGYASTYEMLKSYFERKGTEIIKGSRVTGIVSGAEMLYDDTREVISRAFNCRCYSRYSNQENGVIGQDDIENNVFIINEANYIVEILKFQEDRAAEEGEVGRIVVTDLYNKAMPMIRYDTGDIGSITYVERKGVLKKAIENFGGRRVDMVYDCNGDVISPSTIVINFGLFPQVKQFQFIQEGRRSYRIRINSPAEAVEEEKVRDTFKKILGSDAEILVEFVGEIPILSSGKRKCIMNLMEA